MNGNLKLWGWNNEPTSGTALVVVIILAVVAAAVIAAYAVLYLRHLKQAVVAGEPSGKRFPSISKVALGVGACFVVGAIATWQLFPEPSAVEGDAVVAIDMSTNKSLMTLAPPYTYYDGTKGDSAFAQVYYPDGTVPDKVAGYDKSVREEDGVTFTVFTHSGTLNPFQPEVLCFATITDAEAKTVQLNVNLGTATESGEWSTAKAAGSRSFSTRAPFYTGRLTYSFGGSYLAGDTILLIGRLRSDTGLWVNVQLWDEDGWDLPENYDDIDLDEFLKEGELKDGSGNVLTGEVSEGSWDGDPFVGSIYHDQDWEQPETPDHEAETTVVRSSKLESDPTGRSEDSAETALLNGTRSAS